MSSELGNKLKMLRKQKCIRQDVVADYLGVARGSISHYEKGTRIPPVQKLEKLAIFYNVSMDYFIPTKSKDEVKDLLARATDLFKSETISTEDKTKLYNQLMKIYINSQDENILK